MFSSLLYNYTMNLEIKKDFSPSPKKGIIPKWVKRELSIFGGMILESLKFILVSILVFGSVYGVINGPAIWNNVKWWWYVNYIEDHSGKWWGDKFPDTTGTAEPFNTLFIPKIGVQAPIKKSTSRAPGEINDLLLQGVVHYYGTAYPGETGNVFLTGHSSYYWWSKGEYNDVFSILDKVVVGDYIYVNYGEGSNSKRYSYKIYEIKIVSPSEVSVLEQKDSESILTLMTCTPVGTNYKRLIVKAKQEDPNPTTNKPRTEKYESKNTK